MIKKVFPVIGLATFASMLGIGIIAPFIPLYARSLGADGLMIGVILAGYSVSKAVVMPFIGRFSDRKGRKLFLVIGLGCYTFLSLAYIWGTNVYLLALIRIVHGMAGGMVLPVARAWVGDVTPDGEEGTWQGYFNTIWFGGMGCGPVMGGLLNDYFGMSAAFLAMGALSLLAFIGVVFFLPEAQRSVKARPKTLVSFRKMGGSGVFLGVFSLKILESTGRRSFFGFLPIFAGIQLGLSTTEIGLLFAVDTIVSALLQAPAGKLADVVNKRLLIVVASFLGGLYMALTPMTTSFWWLLSVILVAGLRAAITSGGTSAFMVEEGRRFGMGWTMAMLSMAVSIGEGIGPVFGGFVVDRAGVTGNFYVSAGLMVMAAIVFMGFTQVKDRVISTKAETMARGQPKPPVISEEDVV
ncbi:MAG: MFS transporter [Dehalococcoidia bacterium]|nr:MFS transporter [Dehalococcoidia bacterium]